MDILNRVFVTSLFLSCCLVVRAIHSDTRGQHGKDKGIEYREKLYGRLVVGDCGSGKGGFTSKEFITRGFNIRFRIKHTWSGKNVWSITKTTEEYSPALISGTLDVSIVPDSHGKYTLTLDLKSSKTGRTVAKLVKPHYVSDEFVSGLIFVRPDLREEFYKDLNQFAEKSPGGETPVTLMSLITQLALPASAGKIVDVDEAAFRKIGGLGYVYGVLR